MSIKVLVTGGTFDKEYDETPYRLLDKYKEQQKSMPPEEFKEFFIENLVEIHKSPRDFAEELATGAGASFNSSINL